MCLRDDHAINIRLVIKVKAIETKLLPQQGTNAQLHENVPVRLDSDSPVDRGIFWNKDNLIVGADGNVCDLTPPNTSEE
jgi:hypothetical protein